MIAGLEEAVEAGVIDQDTAKRLEPYLAAGGTPAERPDPDDEKLRLVTGFNDIFVTIGLLMFLGALGYMLSGQGLISSLVLAAAAWGLAEFFTRMRRMALPSIVLLIVFVGAVFVAVQATTATSVWGAVIQDSPGLTVIAGIAAAVAAGVHWWRFQVPITVAAGAAALVAIVLSLGAMAAPELVTEHPAVVFLPLGLLVFALAMWFDSADLKRQTAEIDDLQALAARKQAAIVELDAQTGHAQGLVTALENECGQLDQQLSARLQEKQRLRADIKAKAVAFAEAPLPKEAEQHMLATRQLREERELLVGRMRHR